MHRPGMVDLIINFRRDHGFDLKLKNQQYYYRTIAKARKSIAEESANKSIETSNILRNTPYKGSKAEILEALSTTFGIKIHSIKKFVGDKPSFEMKTEKGIVFLPKIDDLIRPSILRKRLAEMTGDYIRYSTNTWPDVAQALLDACDMVNADPEASIEKRIKSWLSEYLTEFTTVGGLDDSVKNGNPFVKDGSSFIKIEPFTEWAFRTRHYRQGPRKLALELARCGLKSVKFNVKIEGSKTSRRYWEYKKSYI